MGSDTVLKVKRQRINFQRHNSMQLDGVRSCKIAKQILKEKLGSRSEARGQRLPQRISRFFQAFKTGWPAAQKSTKSGSSAIDACTSSYAFDSRSEQYSTSLAFTHSQSKCWGQNVGVRSCKIAKIPTHSPDVESQTN